MKLTPGMFVIQLMGGIAQAKKEIRSDWKYLTQLYLFFCSEIFAIKLPWPFPCLPFLCPFPCSEEISRDQCGPTSTIGLALPFHCHVFRVASTFLFYCFKHHQDFLVQDSAVLRLCWNSKFQEDLVDEIFVSGSVTEWIMPIIPRNQLLFQANVYTSIY